MLMDKKGTDKKGTDLFSDQGARPGSGIINPSPFLSKSVPFSLRFSRDSEIENRGLQDG